MESRGIHWLIVTCLVAVGCSGDPPPGEDERVGAEVPPAEPDGSNAEEAPGESDARRGPRDEGPDDLEPPSEPVDEAEPDDPYAVPDEIDAEYLDSVFEAINDVALAAQQEVVENQQYTEQADELLQQIYIGYALEDQRAEYRDMLANESPGAHLAGGALITTAERIADRTSSCLAVLARQDRSELLVDPPESSMTYTFLVLNGDIAGTDNSTPWMLAARVQEFAIDVQDEEDLCERFEQTLVDEGLL